MPLAGLAVIAHLVQPLLGAVSSVERVAEGSSTEVYRIWRGDACFYLRVLPEVGASFAPEVYVHALLHTQGVRVPEVIFFEHRNAVLQRSLMVMTALAGQALGYGARPTSVRALLRQAGRDLALINRVAVQGFGWIDRPEQAVAQLRAAHATYEQWLAQDFAAPIRALRRYAPLAAHAPALQRLAEESVGVWCRAPAALAHGDFDPTHIFHHDGVYTGVIDFGELRGAQPLYDLGHFAIENNDLLPDLLAGYAQVAALPDDYAERVLLSALLIAARRVGRRVLAGAAPHAPDVRFIRRRLRR